MKDKALKTALILTHIFFVLLVIVVILLPWLITLYVEWQQRYTGIATTIMVTCYPLAPVVALIIFKLRKLIKNIMNGLTLTKENSNCFKIISLCCLVISLVCLIAGRFYIPFFIVGATFLFLALLCFIFTAIFMPNED